MEHTTFRKVPSSLSLRFSPVLSLLLLVPPLHFLTVTGCTQKERTGPRTSLTYPFVPGKGPKPYRAGVAVGPLFSPWGLSMGGFGFRVGPLTGRNEHLGSAIAWIQTLQVKALAIGNDHGLVIFTKLPLIFTSDLLRRRILVLLAERTGYDFSPSLILTATHTHSAPARFWALPKGAGIFGMDEYDPAVLEGLADSIALVVEEAWRAMVPAKIGIAELPRFDPEDRISSDRRPEDDNLYKDSNDPNVYRRDDTFKTKDHILTLIKVVDARTGAPLAGAIRFGIHGTIFADEAYTEDAPGGIEAACEEAFGVPVLFLQGAAGDVSPRGDDHDKRWGTQQMEAVGRYTAQVAAPLWESVTLETEGEIAMAHQWLLITRERLGYGAKEFGVRVGSNFFPYPHGAFQCGNFGPSVTPDEGNPATRLEDGALGCLDIDQFQALFSPTPDQYEFPIGELSRAVQSAVRIGSYYFVTFPGEPVSPLMSQMRARAREMGIDRLVVLGYSQNHLFYLTPEEDWFQGGYEAAMNIWGWKLGDFLIRQNLKLLKRLQSDPGPPYWEGDPIVPLKREGEWREVMIQANKVAPHWITISSTQLPLLGMIEGSWLGGDSWLSPPWVKIVRVRDGKILRHSGGFGFLITAQETQEGSVYTLRFQAGLDLRQDLYRFEAQGRFKTQAGEILPYTVTSPEFWVTGGAILEATGTVTGTTLRLYPAIISNPIVAEILARDLMNRYQTGGFRLISLSTGPNEETPLTTSTLKIRIKLYPSQTTLEFLDAPWDPLCSCYPLTLPDPYPLVVTGVELEPYRGIEWEGNTLRRRVKIPP